MSEVSEMHNQGEEQLELPPGFRFHPTDEEVVSHYLIPKALSCLFTCLVIADVDLNKCEPWELPGKAKMGEKEWYFFCHKDRKYPTGTRTNRATASGYWKATGKDKEIFRGRGVLVGMKKTLVFYLGRAPHGKKTPWVMHEYRIEGRLPPNLPRAAKDEWAVCRVFNKEYLAAKPGLQQTASTSSPAAAGTMQRSDSLAFLDDLLDPADLPPLTDSPFADDFKGAAVPGSMSNMISGCQQVKTEQPAPAQNPPPPALMQDTAYSYFSLPATNNSTGGYSHHPQAAGAGHLSAIRRHCTATAPALASPDIARTPPYPELESLDDLGGFMDYSNMWKC